MMGNKIASEFRKLTTTRSAYWLLAVLAGLAVMVAAGAVLGEDFAKDLTKPVQEQPFLLLTLSSATIFPLMLGILSVTDEFRHGTIVPTLLVTPDRRQVLAAKVVTVGVTAVMFMAIAIAVSLAFGVVWLRANGYEVTWSGVALAEVCGRAIVAGVLWSAIGIGIGLAVRRQMAAILGVSVWSLAVETAIGAMLPSVEKYLPDSAGTAIVGFDAADLLAPVAAMAVLAVWAILVVAVGERLMERRDVT